MNRVNWRFYLSVHPSYKTATKVHFPQIQKPTLMTSHCQNQMIAYFPVIYFSNLMGNSNNQETSMVVDAKNWRDWTKVEEQGHC